MMSELRINFENEVFNEIIDLHWGSSILVLDTTHFESVPFLTAVLGSAFPREKVHFISFHQLNTPYRQTELNASITISQELYPLVNKLREELLPYGIIVHHYLPRILATEDEQSILRILEFWTSFTASKALLEFYILPKEAFPSFEERSRRLMSGVLTLSLSNIEPTTHAFTAEGLFKPQYKLREFPYIFDKGSLLIKFGDKYTSYLQTSEIEEFEKRAEYLKNNIASLRLAPTDMQLIGFSLQERWLFSQISDKHLLDVKTLFPEKFDELLSLIARWHMANLVAFKIERKPTDTLPPKGRFKLRNRLALKLPVSISGRILSKSPNVVTLDAYRNLRSSVELILRHSGKHLGVEEFTGLESMIQEFVARSTALEKLRRNNENPDIKFDLEYLPKVTALTIYSIMAYRVIPKIIPDGERRWKVIIKDCPLCKDSTAEKPLCHIVESSLKGTCAVLFKEAFVCSEISCMAMGAEACVFRLEVQRKYTIQ